ncbi:MFS general substrate transporter [Panus rudis PR-1116 ss-1]|nr:MFS general substrate transporter [Panus rudis PR-1116 ss-1]
MEANLTKESTEISLPDSPESKDIERVQVGDPQIEVPDGGLRAWMSVAGGWIITFCTFGYIQSFGVYEDLYVLSGAGSPTNIAWIGSFQLFMIFVMGLPAGKLFDMGYFHHLEICGSLLLVFSLFMLSLVDTSQYYQIFLSQGVGVGIGCGMLFLPALSAQSHHWKNRRALAMGIVLTGSSIGGVIHPIMHNQLFHGKTGFAWGVRASAFMMGGLLVIANCLMSTRLPPKRHGPKAQLGTILRDIPYMVVTIGTCCVCWGLYFPYFYLQLYVDLHGLSTTLAFYTIAILNAASVFGRTIPNLIADKYGQFNVFAPIAFMCGILVFAMFGITNTAGVIVFSILYGFASGGFVSLVPPLLAVLAQDVTQIGIYMGVGFFIVGWAQLTGTPISGALLGDTYVWHKAIIFSGVTMLVGTAFIIVSRQMLVKRRGSQLL